MVVEDLLAKRVLAVPKGASIRSGSPLALRRMPADDIWNGPNARSPCINPVSRPRTPRARAGADGMIRFTLPKVAIGPAQIDESSSTSGSVALGTRVMSKAPPPLVMWPLTLFLARSSISYCVSFDLRGRVVWRIDFA